MINTTNSTDPDLTSANSTTVTYSGQTGTSEPVDPSKITGQTQTSEPVDLNIIIGSAVGGFVTFIIIVIIVIIIIHRRTKRRMLPPPLPDPYQIGNIRNCETSRVTSEWETTSQSSSKISNSARYPRQTESTKSKTDSVNYEKPVVTKVTIIHSDTVDYIKMDPNQALSSDRKSPPGPCKSKDGYVNTPDKKSLPAPKIQEDYLKTTDLSVNDMTPQPVCQEDEDNNIKFQNENSGEEYEDVGNIDTYGRCRTMVKHLESPVKGKHKAVSIPESPVCPVNISVSKGSSTSSQESCGNYENVSRSGPGSDDYQAGAADSSQLRSSNDSLDTENNERPSSYVNVKKYQKMDEEKHAKGKELVNSTSSKPSILDKSSKPKTPTIPKVLTVFPKTKPGQGVFHTKTYDLSKDVDSLRQEKKVRGNPKLIAGIRGTEITDIKNEDVTVASQMDESSKSPSRKFLESEPISSKNLRTIQQVKVTDSGNVMKHGAETNSYKSKAGDYTNLNKIPVSKPKLSSQSTGNINMNKSFNNNNEMVNPHSTTMKQDSYGTTERTKKKLPSRPQYPVGAPRFPLQHKFVSTPNVSTSASLIEEMKSKLKKIN